MAEYPLTTIKDRIESIRRLHKSLKEGRYSSLGSYPKFYYTKDGDVLSHEAVKENLTQIRRAMLRQDDKNWCIVGVEINWEDPNLYCADTGERIPSAYAEDSSS